jgi:DNA-binding NarL/FixJ family response regulator
MTVPWTSPKLSSLELRIVQLVAEGKKNPDIAAVIGRTKHITKNRLRNIYDKTGMGNRVELAVMVRGAYQTQTVNPRRTGTSSRARG